MIFEPGILDLAHSKGIKYLDDINKDGIIDGKDLKLAQVELASKTAVKTVNQGAQNVHRTRSAGSC